PRARVDAAGLDVGDDADDGQAFVGGDLDKGAERRRRVELACLGQELRRAGLDDFALTLRVLVMQAVRGGHTVRTCLRWSFALGLASTPRLASSWRTSVSRTVRSDSEMTARSSALASTAG